MIPIPAYRAEAWFIHHEHDAEDMLEERLQDLMRQNGMRVQGGPVVFRIYPNGEAGRIHDRATTS